MSAKVQFTKGEFQIFRVTTQVHIGRLERYLEKDDEVEFDGHTLKFEGSDHSIPQLRGAVLSGWLVPASDTTTVYKPKSSNITIRPAQAANIENRGKAMEVTQAQDDNVVVGRVYNNDTTETTQTETAEAGQSVAKISTPARQRTKITDSSAAQSAINRLDNQPPPKATKVATGDVEVATAGDSLEEILPEAATTSTPEATTKTTKTASKTKVVVLENGVEWDMGRHWRTRGRDATKTYGTDELTLNLIRSVEVPSVIKMIDTRLDKA